MWNLFLEYEEDLALRKPLNAEDFLDEKKVDEYVLKAVSGGYIESDKFSYVFTGDIKMKELRVTPQQLSINLNLTLPANVNQSQITPQQLQAIQQQISPLVTEEINRQSPISGYNARVTNANWHKKKWS